MKKSTIIAGLVGAIVLFALGYLWYALSGIMESYATEAGAAAKKGEDTFSMPLLILGHLVTVFLMSVLYSKWARGTHNFGHGFQFGALIGAFAGVGLALMWFASTDLMTSTGWILDGIFQIVSLGITGGVIALLYHKFDE